MESPVLLRVGRRSTATTPSSPHNPTTLSDVYFRVGGPHIGRTDIALEVNSDNVLIDHTWVWRGRPRRRGLHRGRNGDTERWHTNTGRNGAVINGDDVTATGLFVEHFQQYNTVWNGEHGTTILYQNELPYDPPTQADWMNGTARGLGRLQGRRPGAAPHACTAAASTSSTRTTRRSTPRTASRCRRRPGVQLHHIMTVNLSAGTIDHVVNGVGRRGRHDQGRRSGLHDRVPDPVAGIGVPTGPEPAMAPAPSFNGGGVG